MSSCKQRDTPQPKQAHHAADPAMNTRPQPLPAARSSANFSKKCTPAARGGRAAGGMEEEGTKKACFEKKSKQAIEKKLCHSRSEPFFKGTAGCFPFSNTEYRAISGFCGMEAGDRLRHRRPWQRGFRALGFGKTLFD